MLVIDLINREKSIGMRSFVILGCLSGLANTLILATINIAAELASDVTKPNQVIYLMAIFLLSVLIFGLTQRRLMLRANAHVEEAINRMRTELMDHIHRCELTTIEKIGRERIFTTMNKEMQTISNASQLFVIVGQASILILFTAIYIASLSLVAVTIIVLCVAFGVTIHLRRAREIRHQLRTAFDREKDLVSKLTDILDGFKETKLNRIRARELKQEYSNSSTAVTESQLNIQVLYANDAVISEVSFYLGIGAVAFLVPLLSTVYPDVVIKVTTATLFLMGPINSVVGGMPTLAATNAAAKNIMALEAELKAARGEVFATEPLTSFNEIKLQQLSFEHRSTPGERVFGVGPIEMTIKQGQTVFITGGNGSGKTTFIRLLTGLYRPTSGRILVDGNVMENSDLDSYRDLFTAVFSDFHLFNYLYGTPEFDQHEADKWLKIMEMDGKVHIRDKTFSTIELSGGQRKRLALLGCVLENRPIYIFDEWAADQDPYFREKFYMEILPLLKARNQTVIAITHDDKFFDMADVHLKMTDGQLSEIPLQASQSPTVKKAWRS